MPKLKLYCYFPPLMRNVIYFSCKLESLVRVKHWYKFCGIPRQFYGSIYKSSVLIEYLEFKKYTVSSGFEKCYLNRFWPPVPCRQTARKYKGIYISFDSSRKCWPCLPGTPWNVVCPWWCHQMEAFSVLVAFCVGNSPVTGEFPSQTARNADFDVSLMWVFISC